MGLRDEWYVRDGLTDYLVVLRFDVEPCERGQLVDRWLARSMALGWLRHPRNRGLMLELFERVRLHPFGGDGIDACEFQRTLEQTLGQAFEHGDLVLLRIRERGWIRTSGYSDEEVERALGPDSRPTPQDTTVWIGIKLVDEAGAPVPARPYRVVTPDGETIDGQLDSNGAAMIRTLKTPGTCKVSCPYVAPHGSLTYTVKPGEHISGIAQAYGFDDYRDVWNHPENADLRQQRPDPHVLQPGDHVYIPEAKDQPASKPTGAQHTLSIKRSPLKVRIKFVDLANKPLAAAKFTLGGATISTDRTGLAEATIDKGAAAVPLDGANTHVALNAGNLNPSDDATAMGWRARLFNLGFLWDPMVDDTDDEMTIALQDFQAQYSLPVTGQLDDATKSQLLQSYGC
jgi:N-acetylmuramoyl-L-alanine amidase